MNFVVLVIIPAFCEMGHMLMHGKTGPHRQIVRVTSLKTA